MRRLLNVLTEIGILLALVFGLVVLACIFSQDMFPRLKESIITFILNFYFIFIA